jgi:hypothetical protein
MAEKSYPKFTINRYKEGVGVNINADTIEEARELYDQFVAEFGGESGYVPKDKLIEDKKKLAEQKAIIMKMRRDRFNKQ